MPRRRKQEKTRAPLEKEAIQWRELLTAVDNYEYYYNYFDFCLRFANFFKVHIMLSFARVHHGARFVRSLEGRQLFYTFKNKFCFFCTQSHFLRENSCSCFRKMRIPREMKFFSKCERRNDEQQLDQLLTVSRRFRGPHILDLGVFIHLSRYVHLGNDLALYIFDFM